MKHIIWYLIAGSRGGESRARIISLLEKKPCNANQISEDLKLDYKTIRHHLKILEKHNVIYSVDKGNYGACYFLTEWMSGHKSEFGEIWERFGSK